MTKSELFEFNDSIDSLARREAEEGKASKKRKMEKGVERIQFEKFMEDQLTLRRLMVPFLSDDQHKIGIKKEWNKRHPEAQVIRRTPKKTLIPRKQIKKLYEPPTSSQKKNHAKSKVSFSENVTVKEFRSSQASKRNSNGKKVEESFREFFGAGSGDNNQDDDFDMDFLDPPARTLASFKEDNSSFKKTQDMSMNHNFLSPIPFPEDKENQNKVETEEGRGASFAGGDSAAAKKSNTGRKFLATFGTSSQESNAASTTVQETNGSVFSFPEKSRVKTYGTASYRYKLPLQMTSTPIREKSSSAEVKSFWFRGESTYKETDNQDDMDFEAVIPRKKPRTEEIKQKDRNKNSQDSSSSLRPSWAEPSTTPNKDRGREGAIASQDSSRKMKIDDKNVKNSVSDRQTPLKLREPEEQQESTKKMSLLTTIIHLGVQFERGIDLNGAVMDESSYTDQSIEDVPGFGETVEVAVAKEVKKDVKKPTKEGNQKGKGSILERAITLMARSQSEHDLDDTPLTTVVKTPTKKRKKKL